MGSAPETKNRLTVVGLGYIGLPTAVVFAQNGWDVTGVDVTEHVVDTINAGELPFVEEGLDKVLADVVKSGKLHAQTNMPASDIYIVSVPTPFKADHEADLSYIEAVSHSIAPLLQGDELVVLESTSPPGTTEQMAAWILEDRPDLSLDGQGGKPIIHFAHAPERVLPGRIMVELVSNDRVIGGMTQEAALRARDVYATFCDGELSLTDARTAEMAKLTENSFRDVNIAFANELSIICQRLGIDVWELIEMANRHPRVNILQPGPGVGGHCIAVDPWFIVSSAPEEARLIRTAREVNDSKPAWVIDSVGEALAAAGDGARVAVLGLAFKADIDDLRESPAVSITRELAERNPAVQLLVSEPNITQLPAKLQGLANVTLTDTDQAIADSDVVLLLVDHKEYKQIPAAELKGKVIIDTKGLWR